jgi:hypothetical protein
MSAACGKASAGSGDVSAACDNPFAGCGDVLDNEDGNCGNKIVGGIDRASLEASCKAFAKAVTFS